MPPFESVLRDVRLSLRNLAREKSFTATALLILSLCLAANIAIFAVVNSVLLKPLPFTAPEQLVLVANAYPKAGVPRAGASVPHYLERKEQVAAFADAGAVRGSGVTIGEAGSPERVDATSATPSFFRTLGVNAALGRTFTDEEGFYGKHLVVILSDSLWRQRFGADPAVIGQKMRINTEQFTIVGVMPPSFRYLSQRAKLWTPLCFSDDDRKQDRRHSNNMQMIARLKPGESVGTAQAQVDALNARTLKEDPFGKTVIDAGFHTFVRDLGQDYVAELRPVLLLLQTGVLFLLLIGAVNLANLLLVRATGRTKEFCVRQALGASWGQLARSLVTETVVLSVLGGVIGLALGAAAVRGIVLLAADQLPVAIDPSLDFNVYLAALAGTIVLGVVLAVPVIWHTLHGNLTAALSVESRGGTTTRAVHRLRHALIVAQIALAFVLLAGTGLLGLSFARVMAVNPGFQAENVLTGTVALPWVNYKEDKQRLAFIDRLLVELQGVPGVTSVGIGTGLPFTGSANNNATWIEGREPAQGESLQAHYTSGVAGDYFQTLGVPLREGRYLTAADLHGENRVCVIDEDVARRYWPKASAVGHRLSNEPPGKDQKLYTIVGVVGAVKQTDLADARANGAIYFPYNNYASTWFALTVRTTQPAELAGKALRGAVLRIDPELPVDDLKTMETRVADSVAGRRVPLLLAGIFAAVALVLAAVGIYGVLAYTVAQRQREIGVRMALGALPEQILAQFLGLGGRLLLIGLPLGLLGAWFAGRAMSGMLFGVAPSDVTVLGGTAVVLSLVAVLACLIPSRRAARVTPVEALRAN
ncbi:ABC transporter permease [Opitutus terrae]|uniref:Permease n=1 Tax=Opitutus terrae (strain DSM 11246 / JCM 15787 / PB90-1) TaxID=452637 RepID=B1ZU61_OPITP|nr:ABC transporter permease [Opitutus terrae]ACB76627.1 permease [Opitutus terrae PB90-1]